jgi:anthranilate phosphoribosyltransferase
MRHVGPVRRELGLRTIFNLAGPLSNPAGVRRQLVGVYSEPLVPIIAQTLALLGVRRAWVVHGAGGLDELSLAGETRVSEVREDGSVRSFQVTPEEAGLPRATVAALQGGTADDNARILMEILEEGRGPQRDAVLLNAAAALIVGGRAQNLREGVSIAERAIDSGAALARLEGLLARTGKGASR